MAVTVTLSFLCATCYGTASAFQHQAASAQPRDLSLRPGLFLRLARNPRWLLGNALDVAGYGCEVLALRSGALALVQPILVAGLLVSLVASAGLARRRISARELGAAVAVAGGLALFLWVANPTAGRTSAPMVGLTALTVAAVVVIGLAVLLARGTAPARTAFFLALGAGIANGYMASMTAATWQRSAGGFVHALATPAPYAVVVSAILGIWLAQSAFHAGHLRYSLPTLSVVSTLVAVVIGVALFGERLEAAALAPMWEVVGSVAMVAGVVALSSLDVPA